MVDNDGYTIERAIHGPEQPYNDIAQWDWTAAPALFGPDRASVTRRVMTAGELDEALAGARRTSRRLALIQAVVPKWTSRRCWKAGPGRQRGERRSRRLSRPP